MATLLTDTVSDFRRLEDSQTLIMLWKALVYEMMSVLRVPGTESLFT
jgi:hypothetical protein